MRHPLLVSKLVVYEILCAIMYHFYNLKNVKNIHGVVLLFVKLPAKASNFGKSSTLLWVFFTFFKLYIWYQIVQRITYAIYNLSRFLMSVSEASLRRCSYKKVLWRYAENSQEKTHAEVWFE